MRTARNRGTLTRETMERPLLCRPHCPFCGTAPFRGQASTVLRPANAEVKIPEDFYCTKWSAGEGRTSLHFRGREPEHAFPAAHSGIEADRQAAGGIVCTPENRRGSQKEKEINSSTLGFVRQFTGKPLHLRDGLLSSQRIEKQCRIPLPQPSVDIGSRSRKPLFN